MSIENGEKVTAWVVAIFIFIFTILCIIGVWYEWNDKFDKAHYEFYEGSVK